MSDKQFLDNYFWAAYYCDWHWYVICFCNCIGSSSFTSWSCDAEIFWALFSTTFINLSFFAKLLISSKPLIPKAIEEELKTPYMGKMLVKWIFNFRKWFANMIMGIYFKCSKTKQEYIILFGTNIDFSEKWSEFLEAREYQ